MRSILLLIAIISISLLSCTDNTMARSYGGTETIELAPNEKLINVTWKQTDLWYLVEDVNTGEMSFKEKSAMGIMEGCIKFKQNCIQIAPNKVPSTTRPKEYVDYIVTRNNDTIKYNN